MEMIHKFLNPIPQYHFQNMKAILQSSEVFIATASYECKKGQIIQTFSQF